MIRGYTHFRPQRLWLWVSDFLAGIALLLFLAGVGLLLVAFQ